MDHLEDSTDRSRFELTLVAITFFSVLIGLAGIVLAMPLLAILGGIIALLSVLVFLVRSYLS
jgi:hypothetical protein